MGIIFDISRFSLNDGPGIRTTVFLKGCPLRCVWCHNPESQLPKPQLAYFEERCTLCGRCADCGVHTFSEGLHRVDFARCSACGRCVQHCPSGALKLFGYEASVYEIMDIVRRDRAYYDESGGGLTISGGEPMFQQDFTLALLKKAKAEGIHTAMETCGYAPTEAYMAMLPYTDLFLYDYKGGERDHKRLTGVDRQLIDKNLGVLLDNGARVILRCPVVPGLNEDEAALQAYAARYPKLVDVERLPYHNWGESKKKAIGKG